jgi:HD-GYP domain-containing protein (c-di-GMP phosphodiesterase class II)
MEQAQRLYDEALAAVRALDAEDVLRAPGQVKAAQFIDLSRRIFALFADGDYCLMSLAARPAAFDHNQHVVNAAILSLYLQCVQGEVSAEERDILGLSAFLQNIGMAACRELIAQAGALSPSQRDLLRTHPAAGARIVEKMDGLDAKMRSEVSRTIGQTHERVDGNGYPAQLRGAALSPRAQLLGVADVYQALTHERPWRKAVSPPEALRTILELKVQGFSEEIRHLLVRALTIYPFGTLVRLATGETAEVIEPNRYSVMHPKVRLLDGVPDSKAGNVVLDLTLSKFTSVIEVLEGLDSPKNPS